MCMQVVYKGRDLEPSFDSKRAKPEKGLVFIIISIIFFKNKN